MGVFHQVSLRLTTIVSITLVLTACGSTRSGDQPARLPLPTTAVTTVPTNGTAPITLLTPSSVYPAPEPIACDNSYFPLVQGANWTYKLTDTVNKPSQQTITQMSNTGKSFAPSLSIANSKGVVNIQAGCSTDGLQFDKFPVIFYGQADPGFNLATIEIRGVYLIPADKLIPGATWNTYYALAGKQVIGQPPITGTVALNSEVIGEETIHVPAGTFTALKIEQQVTYDTILPPAGSGAAATHINQFMWFCKGIGLIKSLPRDPVAAEPMIELIAYHIP